ncbi:hypothetical protein VPH35_017288 [Triticum aestivum]
MRSSLALLLLLGAAIAPILTTGVSPAVNTSVLSPGSTPGSANDTLQRGIIVTNHIAHNVTATLGIISDLVRDLNTCTRLYMTMAKNDRLIQLAIDILDPPSS